MAAWVLFPGRRKKLWTSFDAIGEVYEGMTCMPKGTVFRWNDCDLLSLNQDCKPIDLEDRYRHTCQSPTFGICAVVEELLGSSTGRPIWEPSRLSITAMFKLFRGDVHRMIIFPSQPSSGLINHTGRTVQKQIV
jgi:hypothetical protein